MHQNPHAQRRADFRRSFSDVAEPENTQRFTAHLNHGVIIIGKCGAFLPIPARDGGRVVQKTSRARQQ